MKKFNLPQNIINYFEVIFFQCHIFQFNDVTPKRSINDIVAFILTFPSISMLQFVTDDIDFMSILSYLQRKKDPRNIASAMNRN